METVKERERTAKKKQPGRPKKPIKKSEVLVVRLTSIEYLAIKTKASQAGIKPSTWFRMAARNATITPRCTPEEASNYRKLCGMANNLNQLTKLAHQQGLISLAGELRHILEQINMIGQKLTDHDR